MAHVLPVAVLLTKGCGKQGNDRVIKYRLCRQQVMQFSYRLHFKAVITAPYLDGKK